jgi:hypothetical protein
MGDKSQKTQLSLEYNPTPGDLSMYTVKGQGRSRPSAFLAVAGPSDNLVHGNSVISLKNKNDEDVAADYGTWRQWRIWRLASGNGYNAVGSPESPWDDDNRTGNANWMDIPGYILADDPAQWKEERRMLEFVVAVGKHPEFGALYFFVVISLKPGQYRVEMSSAKDILFAKFKDLEKTRQPWAQQSGCTIKVDSNWLKVRA